MQGELERIVREAEGAKWEDLDAATQAALSPTVTKGSLAREDLAFYHAVISALAPVSAIEVGLATGSSAVCLALAARDSLRRIDAIDPFQSSGFRNAGLEALRAAVAGSGAEVEFHEVPSHIALPRLLDRGQSCDFAMIDASHKFDATLIEVFYVDQMLDVGGVIALDDRPWPMVGGVIEFVRTNYRHFVVNTRHRRLTFLQKLRPDRRAWFDYWHFEMPRNPALEARIEEYRKERAERAAANAAARAKEGAGGQGSPRGE